MKVKFATDVGRVRKINEDSLWVGSQCLVICDGMGGHLAGEVASNLAIGAIKDFPFSGQDPASEIRKAIERAQKEILEASSRQEEYKGMGSTITLAWIEPLSSGEFELTLGHVGDSRAYLFHDGKLEQITNDHSMVAELLRLGTITKEEAKTHKKRHILTQALGSEDIEVELKKRILLPGSVLLLCSDGLTDVVTDDQIAQILKDAHGEESVAEKLVTLANDLGGPDNISVIIALF